ncbi:MAG TPA: hypothetical protein PKX34_00625 [Candidatus Absconditabacterales bacterium]|nr:hypothetical protein [Candidatus Absconditabacterales bacterium]HPK27704.1 hypothetical protein [Candidatus Absconditabacterales bacterium]
MTTKLQQNRSEFLEVKAEGTELLKQLFALKDEKRVALALLLKGVSPEDQKNLRSIYKTSNKQLNEKWKVEHADLITRFQTLREQVKSDDELLQEILEQAKKIGSEDEQFYKELEFLFAGETKTGAESLGEATFTLPNEIQKFQQARESSINLDEATKKEMIALTDKLLQDGTLTYQNHPEGGVITTFNGLSGVENPKFYDATKILKPAFEKDGILDKNEYTVYGQKLSIRAKLKGLRGDIDEWSAKNTANAIKEQGTKYGLKMHSEEDMKTLFEKINTKNGTSWDKNKNIAFWSLCTGCKGWYRLSNYSGSSRSFLGSFHDYRYFNQDSIDTFYAGILL